MSRLLKEPSLCLSQLVNYSIVQSANKGYKSTNKYTSRQINGILYEM